MIVDGPALFEDPEVERLGLVVSALVAEVAVLSERFSAMLAVAEERGAFSAGEIETYRPSAGQSEAWQSDRQDLIRRVFAAIQPGEG